MISAFTRYSRVYRVNVGPGTLEALSWIAVHAVSFYRANTVGEPRLRPMLHPIGETKFIAFGVAENKQGVINGLSLNATVAIIV